MEDPEVVAAIVAGDPAGLAEAYDRYATPLYSYCRSLLREPADAADAVQDTFLVATAKLRDLRDPSRFRPWLYAVARNECFRRLRAGKRLSGLEEAADVPAPTADIGAATEQAELSQLVRAAMDGLNPGERDVIELSLVAEFDGDELAAALGVSRNHAHALLSRARGQLERSLGALIVARTGRDACADLDAMLTGWDGRLTVLMRKRISRHIEQCDICGERKRRELTPALLGGVLPIMALPAISPGFRDQLLHVLADRSPAGTAHRLGVANRAAPFGPNGFPKPVRPPGAGPWRRVLQHPQAAVAAAAGTVIAAGAIAAGIIAGSHHVPPPAVAAGGPAPGVSASAGTPARGGPSGRGPGSGPGGGNGRTGNNGGGNASAGGNGGRGLAPSATVDGGTPAPGTSRSTAPPTPVASSSPAPTATGTVSSSSPPAPPPAPGTLALSTGTLRLVSVKGVATAKFTLTARGGPVSYSITPGASLAGRMTVTPSSGSLASGATVTITVTSTSLIALDGQLTVNPGGQTITVVLSVSL